MVDGVDAKFINQLAGATAGFSGREISKLAIAWQAAAYGTANATIDVALMQMVLEENQASKKQKLSWVSREEAERLVHDVPPAV